jgi:hypothetical protein
MGLEKLRTQLLTDPLVKAYYGALKPEFEEAHKIIRQNKLIKAKFLRILMYMYLINPR